jgi:hypothetical protein
MSPIPFPQGLARDMARVRILAADLRRLVDDLDHHVVISPTAHARIDCLAHDASMKGFDLIAALGALTETNSARWSAQQDQSYAVDDADQLVAALSNLTDGGAA